MIEDNYIKRFVYGVKNDADFINVDEMKVNNTLYELIKEQNKVFLLGSPGSGKSTELKNLFETLWDEKDVTGNIPFLIDLKIFRKTTSFVDLIPYKDWKGLSSIIFLLDSLDEIADVQDFISELELFIMNNSKREMKFIIACRTNIYYSHFINLIGFQAFQLQELNTSQIHDLLLNFLHSNENLMNFMRYDRTPFMNSPFFLTKLAELFVESNEIPKTEKDLWELYINTTLAKQIKKDVKRQSNIPWLKETLKRVAVVCELQQKSEISEEELFFLVGKEHKKVLDSPFFKKSNNDNWNFEHRQIQEYFVAKVLSELNFSSLMNIITVNHVSKVHPSLYNVTSFLIGIIDNEKLRTDLINWFVQNDIDPLIKADPERVSEDIRINVFQSYFIDHCINKRLWISTNNSFSIDELGRFSNCKENSNYLIDLILDLKSHFRVRGSALNILSFHDKMDKDDLVEKYLALLKVEGDEFNLMDKSNIVRSIYDLRLDKVDEEIIRKVIGIFKEKSNKELNNSILNLLTLVNTIDDYFEYLHQEFLWSHDILVRKEMDDVHRGNSYKVNNLILKLEDPSNFAELASYFFDHYQVKCGPDFSEKLLSRVVEFTNKDKSFILNLVSKIEKNVGPRNHQNEDLLALVINETKSNLEAFKLIYNQESFRDRKWLLARISNEETIDFFIESINEPTELSSHLQGFRNILSNYKSLELAHYYVDKLKLIGINFSDSLQSQEEYDGSQSQRIEKIQQDFEILFNKSKLLKKVIANFDGDSITMKDLNQIRIKYYENPENYQTDTPSEIDALRLILKDKNSLTKTQVEEELIKDSTLLKLLRDKLEIRKDRKLQFNFSGFKSEIEQKVELLSKEIPLENLFIYEGINSFSYRNQDSYNAYQTLKVIHYFLDSEEFTPVFTDEFLLNSMEYYRLEEPDESMVHFSNFIELIQDKQALDNKIVENINKRIFSFSWDRHVIYALNNNLKATYYTIREYFRTKNNLLAKEKLFELYLAKTNDFELLEELLNDLSIQSGWTAMELLLDREKGNNNRFIEKAITYLNSSVNTAFISNAIRVLFDCNDESALFWYMKFMGSEYAENLSISRIKDYNAIKKENYSVLVEYFNKIHDLGRDSFEFSYRNELLHSIINNISSTSEAFNELKNLFNALKENILKLDPELKHESNDSKIFYASLLLDNMEKSYISSLSKPYTFNHAKEKVNEILPMT